MRLPGAYRSLPRPSSALKPSHPSHSVVTSKILLFPQLESEPIHGLIAEPGCPIRDDFTLHPRHFLRGLHVIDYDSGSSMNSSLLSVFVLGGDPAAGSPTATLLRLNPPYEAQVRNGQHSTIPHPNLIRVVRRAVCARSRDVFTAR